MNVIKTPPVTTKEGQLVGKVEGKVSVFKGIPYAKPPVVNLRWRAPERIPAWTGTREALEFGPSALQSREACIAGGGGDPGKMSEDCLYLNVWTPKTDPGAKLPVLFWIHGGAFVIGTGCVPPYDGTQIAARDVVLVTFNYRLGHLGFFAHPELEKENPGGPANFGILDQMLALEWVKNNIAQFGGDPENITIMGQSAGAKSVLAFFTSPLVQEKKLFRRGVAMSAYVIQEKSVTDAKLAGMAFAHHQGIPWQQATMEKLRKLNPEKFWALPSDSVNAPSPIYGDSVLPEPIRDSFKKGAQLNLPLIIGSTSDDSSVVTSFGIDPATIIGKLPPLIGAAIRLLYAGVEGDGEIGRRMCRDFVFSVVPRHLATLHAQLGAPVWRYNFDYRAESLASRMLLGVPHGGDVSYFLETADHVPPTGDLFQDADRKFTSHLVESLVQFLRTGTPGPVGTIAWTAHTADSDKLLRLDSNVRMVDDFDAQVLKTAETFMPIIDTLAKPPPPALPKSSSSTSAAKDKSRP